MRGITTTTTSKPGKVAVVRDWLVCVAWVVLIFLTIPLGTQIRDWMMVARKPAEAGRYSLSLSTKSLGVLPLVSHGADGFSQFDLQNGALLWQRQLNLPHEHAAFVAGRLCLTRDGTLTVYDFQKDRPAALRNQVALAGSPVEMIPWLEPYVAVRFDNGVIQIVDASATVTNAVRGEFRPPVPVTRMGNLLWQLALATSDGVMIYSSDKNRTITSNAVATTLFRTKSPPTMIQMIRGRVIVGEENGTLQELRREGEGFKSVRTIQLGDAPIATTGNRYALFVAGRGGSIAVLDWQDTNRFSLNRVLRVGTPFLDFQFFGEQGFGLIDERTVVQFNPMPGVRLGVQAVIVFLVLVGVAAVWWLVSVRKERSLLRYAVLVVIGIVYAWNLRSMYNSTSPIEALHYIEYGVLGILAVRGLRHHLGDWGVYPAALLIVALVGLLDEVTQWLHPARTEDLRDVLLNTKSGALMLVAFAFGTPLRSQVAGFGAKSQKMFGWLLLMTTVGIALFIQFLSQFGHEIRIPGVGTFVSRLSAESLRSLDNERGVELAREFQKAASLRYEETLKQLENTPFLYELRVHMFRRDIQFGRAGYLVAYKENQIIEGYFSNTVARTTFRWSEAQVHNCLAQVGDEKLKDYRSPVSAELITSYGPARLWSVAGVVVGVCVFLIFRRR